MYDLQILWLIRMVLFTRFICGIITLSRIYNPNIHQRQMDSWPWKGTESEVGCWINQKLIEWWPSGPFLVIHLYLMNPAKYNSSFVGMTSCMLCMQKQPKDYLYMPSWIQLPIHPNQLHEKETLMKDFWKKRPSSTFMKNVWDPQMTSRWESVAKGIAK